MGGAFITAGVIGAATVLTLRPLAHEEDPTQYGNRTLVDPPEAEA